MTTMAGDKYLVATGATPRYGRSHLDSDSVSYTTDQATSATGVLPNIGIRLIRISIIVGGTSGALVTLRNRGGDNVYFSMEAETVGTVEFGIGLNDGLRAVTTNNAVAVIVYEVTKSGDHLVNPTGTSTLTAPSATSTATGWAELTGTSVLTAPSSTSTATGTGGFIGTSVLTAPAATSTATGIQTSP